MCAKQAKKTQTDYTIGGKAISDTAIPLYQQGLTQLSDWTLDPTQQVDTILNKYYSNTPQQSDFLRNYQRAMGNVTANNYAATHGGYSSSGDMARMDQQRNWNDLYSRLQDQGINRAFQMANANIGNLQNSIGLYDRAYGQGKEYSDVEQYNYLVDQNNSFGNQLAGIAGSAGKVLSAIPGPVTQGIGAGLQIAGNLGSVDNSGALASIGAAGTPSSVGWNSMADSIGKGLAGTAALGGDNWVTALFGGKKTSDAAKETLNKVISNSNDMSEALNNVEKLTNAYGGTSPTYFTTKDGVVLRR